MDTLLGFLLENWPYAIWIAMGGAIVRLYQSLKNKAGKAEEKAAEAKEKIDKLPCETHKEILESQRDNNKEMNIKIENACSKIGKLPCEAHREALDLQKDGNRDRDIKIEKITTGMEYINKNISDMSKSLSAIAEKMNVNIMRATPLTQTQSPVMLTDRGREKAKELGIDKMIDDNWERITAIIEEKAQSKNPYDIQQICLDEAIIFPEKFISESDIDKLKLDAYKNGDILQSYMRVVAIIIRDRFFKEHDIATADVDVYEPEKNK